MLNKEINDLISFAEQAKRDKKIQNYQCEGLVTWIIEELKKIQQDPKHEFSKTLRRNIIDSALWETELNERLVIFLDKYDAQRRKSKK